MPTRCLIHCDFALSIPMRPTNPRVTLDSLPVTGAPKSPKPHPCTSGAGGRCAALWGPSLAPKAACGRQRGNGLRDASPHDHPLSPAHASFLRFAQACRRDRTGGGEGQQFLVGHGSPECEARVVALVRPGTRLIRLLPGLLALALSLGSWPWLSALALCLGSCTCSGFCCGDGGAVAKGGREAGNEHVSAHSRGRKRRPQAGPSAPGGAKRSAASVSA